MPKFLSIETHSGATLQRGGYQVTPFSQAVRLQMPGLHGGVIWNRPLSILVVANDGEEQVLPVRDPTRLAILALLGAALFAWLFFRKK
ncbi:MAG: hypothetical protein JXA78_14390 [Anaerolineales bacterium]|nr:hypothetical protein [Anaerolineales bacterium]